VVDVGAFAVACDKAIHLSAIMQKKASLGI